MIEIRFRQAEIRGVGIFDVPTNVSRVDHRTTHGWFVRFWAKRLRVTKMFSDDPFGGPRESFEAACASAEKHRPMPETQAIEDEGGGMRFIEAYKAGRKTPVIYLELSGIKHAAAPKRIYVGTRNTATPERRCAAWKKGLEMRELMLRRYKAEIRRRALTSRRRNV
jgi:hypothetical protein